MHFQGMDFFELAAIGIFVVLVGVFLINLALRKTVQLSMIDGLIAAFAFWCFASYLIYYEQGRFRELARLLIPLFTYIVAKNVLADRMQYLSMLRSMIMGFSVPLFVTIGLIATGGGIETTGDELTINYWTGIPRWQGAFFGAHSLGHLMTFLAMVLLVFYTLDSETGGTARKILWTRFFLFFMALLAITCLFLSQVRTAILGLVIFGAIYLFVYYKRLLLILAIAGSVSAVLAAPILFPFFFPDLVMIQKGEGGFEAIGSGRPRIWSTNLEFFMQLPIDLQLAGVGIGNKVQVGSFGKYSYSDSHNDYLDILLQTGLIGLVLLVAIQFAILRRVLVMPGRERFVFLGVFVAVMVMNFVSNSYVSRFELAQLYYLLMAYVEVAPREEQQYSRRPVSNATS